MSLKLLVIPFSILMVLVIMIGFVKPDITTLQERKVFYATKLEQAQNMNTLLGNIDSLTSSLDGQRQQELFIQNYFPKAMDQGRVIDAFNFLAMQSGVAVSLMDLKEVKNDRTVEEGVPADANAPMSGHPAKIRSFSAQVSVKGQYENIKDFFERIAHMNRMHRLWNFSIVTQDKKQKNGDESNETEILLGSFEAAFEYFDVQPAQNALYVPVFTRGTFDMESLDATKNWVTNKVPPLERSASGRPNPFQ